MDPAAAADHLLTRTLALCQRAREANIPITPSRVLDVFRTLPAIDCSDQDSFRLALRLNLVSSREEEQRFDALFHEFFQGESADRLWPNRIRGESMQGSLGHHFKELDQDITTQPEAFSAEDTSRGLDLASRWDPEAPSLEQIIANLPGIWRTVHRVASSAPPTADASTCARACAAAHARGPISCRWPGWSRRHAKLALSCCAMSAARWTPSIRFCSG